MFNGKRKTEQIQRFEVFRIFDPNESAPPIVPEANNESNNKVECDFEEAVEATGYGRFNILLLAVVGMPSGMALNFVLTTMSFVIQSAECDLQLTLFHKGVLNAITYAGMVISSFAWGYVADTRGRQVTLKYGYLADGICGILGSMSQSFIVLVIFRFLSGFIINGPFAISMAYVAEFHSAKHRSTSVLWMSVFLPIASGILAILAWLIIPQTWSISLFDGAFVYNSWRIFLLVTAIPSLIGSIVVFFLPESPKFLMSQGRNDEAMKIFQRMYAMNTGNPPEEFPVKSLGQEVHKKPVEHPVGQRSLSAWDKTRSGLAQIKPLFSKPYVYRFFMISGIQFGNNVSGETMRLWTPQIFTIMGNFDYENRNVNSGVLTLCEMISASNVSNVTTNDHTSTSMIDTCVPVPVPDRAYIHSIIIACAWSVGTAVIGTLAGSIERKNILLVNYAISAACVFGLNWSSDSYVALGVLMVYVTLMSVSVIIIVSLIVDFTPTSLRSMAVSLCFSIGRIGSTMGNLSFPLLLSLGCMVPFISMGTIVIGIAVISIFIPKPPPKLM